MIDTLIGMHVLTREYQNDARPRQGVIESVLATPAGHYALIVWREQLIRDVVAHKSLVPLSELAGVGGDGTQYRLFADETDRNRYCAALEKFRYNTEDEGQ